ncbi:hypothetical protein ACIQVL_05660 [Streptomyces sp. NPDC090499]|uniref:hypothetical protein n=1 Tax=Streptomyces sp. NPDC090499 TaxID=3365965 RepID=UPI00381B8F23
MPKQDAAARAVDAGAVAAQAVNDYGLNSTQAIGALRAADNATRDAQAQGCTRADFDAEHARRR